MKHDVDTSAPARSWSPELLEAELGAVHAREFARLLCRAALLRLQPSAAKTRCLSALGLEDDPEAWRRAARRARALAEIDGYELAGLLRHALARPLAQWETPAALSAAALELDRSEATRWHAAVLDFLERGAAARTALRALARARRRIDLPALSRASTAGEDRPW